MDKTNIDSPKLCTISSQESSQNVVHHHLTEVSERDLISDALTTNKGVPQFQLFS